MSEYYTWVNVDKNEYLEPGDFGWAINYHHQLQVGNPLLPALRELLATEWNGCRIVNLGDERGMSREIAELLFVPNGGYSDSDIELYIQAGINEISQFPDDYKNVSGLFKKAEKDIRWNIECYIADLESGYDTYNEYQIDTADPYLNLFKREGKNHEYTLNHSKNATSR